MNEATRQRDEELAELIEQSRQLGPMTSEEQREQRISWVFGNCKLSNSDVTREMVENAVDAGPALSRMDGHLATLSEREAPMTIRPVSAYADNEPPLDPPTEEDLAARRKWADRHVAVVTIPIAVSPSPLSARATAPLESLRFQGDPNTVQWWGTGGNLDLSQSTTERKLNLKLDDPPPYHNPLAALRRERKVKSGKAAKLLGISRQRLHVVEHATKPLRCMDRLLTKAAEVWLVDDESTTTPTVMAKELGLSHKESH